MKTIEISTNEKINFAFEYNFSYILVKKIIFSFKDTDDKVTISDLFRHSPSLLIESKTKSGITLSQNYYLSSYIGPNTVNPLIDLKNDSIAIPERNFSSKLKIQDYVNKSTIEFKSSHPKLKVILTIEETPGTSY